MVFFLGCLAILDATRFVQSVQDFRQARARFQRFQADARNQAEGRFANLDELRKAGLLSEHGILLGNFVDESGKEHDVRSDSENSALILGPPSAQKTTSVLLSSLFPNARNPRRLGVGGTNVCVNDPNAESYVILKDWLKSVGVRTFFISPFHKELSERIGSEINDAGLNIWSDLRLDALPAETQSVIVDRAEIFNPFTPKMDSKDRFFNGSARTLNEFFQGLAIKAGAVPTPSMLLEMVLEGPPGIIERCREALEHREVVGDFVAKRAASILGYTTAGDQFAGTLGSCHEGLRLYDSTSCFGEHFTPRGLDPRVLKDEEPTVVFIGYPTQKASSHEAALSLTYTHIIEQLAADPRASRRVTFLLDETASLGYLPTILNAVNQYRKTGQRYILFLQEMVGQIERLYGPPGVKEILAACEVIWASGVREPTTLQMLAKRCGEAVVTDRAMNDPLRHDAKAKRDQTYSRSNKTRPTLRLDDLARMDPSQALVIAKHLHPFFVEKIPYWTRWSKIAGKNPYRQE